MTFLAPSADRAVRRAVDDYMAGRRKPAKTGDALLETRNSRYYLREGVLIDATDTALLGAELVAWLVDDDKVVNIINTWQLHCRAIFVERKTHRQIVVTSQTQAFTLDDFSEQTGSPVRQVGSSRVQFSVPMSAALPQMTSPFAGQAVAPGPMGWMPPGTAPQPEKQSAIPRLPPAPMAPPGGFQRPITSALPPKPNYTLPNATWPAVEQPASQAIPPTVNERGPVEPTPLPSFDAPDFAEPMRSGEIGERRSSMPPPPPQRARSSSAPPPSGRPSEPPSTRRHAPPSTLIGSSRPSRPLSALAAARPLPMPSMPPLKTRTLTNGTRRPEQALPSFASELDEESTSGSHDLTVVRPPRDSSPLPSSNPPYRLTPSSPPPSASAGVDGAGVDGAGVDGAGVDGAGVDGAGKVVTATRTVPGYMALPSQSRHARPAAPPKAPASLPTQPTTRRSEALPPAPSFGVSVPRTFPDSEVSDSIPLLEITMDELEDDEDESSGFGPATSPAVPLSSRPPRGPASSATSSMPTMRDEDTLADPPSDDDTADDPSASSRGRLLMSPPQLGL